MRALVLLALAACGGAPFTSTDAEDAHLVMTSSPGEDDASVLEHEAAAVIEDAGADVVDELELRSSDASKEPLDAAADAARVCVLCGLSLQVELCSSTCVDCNGAFTCVPGAHP